MSRHTCLGCDHHALAASVQASRDTGCCAQLLEADDAITPMERIAYWGSVGAAVGLSLAVVFGAAGYLVAKFLS